MNLKNLSLLFYALSTSLFVIACRPFTAPAIIHHKELVIPGDVENARFSVEIADTPKERAQGLMYRKTLAPDHGMLFIFETSKNHGFWMKNTYIPLDMIFFDETWTVVGIIENAQPHDLTLRSVERPSRYVLEVNAGVVHKYGIKAGQTLKGAITGYK